MQALILCRCNIDGIRLNPMNIAVHSPQLDREISTSLCTLRHLFSFTQGSLSTVLACHSTA